MAVSASLAATNAEKLANSFHLLITLLGSLREVPCSEIPSLTFLKTTRAVV
jgi:hypothetical protein